MLFVLYFSKKQKRSPEIDRQLPMTFAVRRPPVLEVKSAQYFRLLLISCLVIFCKKTAESANAQGSL